MTTFETAKVGDKVYHYRYGWSTITNIKKESNYPIIIDYDFSFTYEGFADKSDKNRTLFWDEIVITPPEKPLPQLEVDTRVLVWDGTNVEPTRAYFSHFEKNGRIATFSGGKTSWSAKNNPVIVWEHWELAKD